MFWLAISFQLTSQFFGLVFLNAVSCVVASGSPTASRPGRDGSSRSLVFVLCAGTKHSGHSVFRPFTSSTGICSSTCRSHGNFKPAAPVTASSASRCSCSAPPAAAAPAAGALHSAAADPEPASAPAHPPR